MTTASVVPTGPSPGAAGVPGKAKTSGLAIASLVAGVLGFCTVGLGGIAGLILGISALKKIRRSGGALRGRALAIAGLIVSTCTLLLWVLAAGISVVFYLTEEMPRKEMSQYYEVNRTRTLLGEVEAALDRYQVDFGHPPTIDEGGLRALLRKPQDPQVGSKWQGPYLSEMPLDPWGHRLDYKPLPSSSAAPYRLWSSGPDGISGTPDDVSLDSSEGRRGETTPEPR
ncbi:MAG: type II secretion system protein GspG [Planctomycetota bacterium]|nr:type II secretion system protein GspG [Planctomycetota bacterium]